MKRKIILVTTVSLALVVLAYSVASVWMGKLAEESIQKKIAWVKTQPYLTVKSHTYQRGWFSSDSITVIDLKSEWYLLTGSAKSDEWTITYKQHIQHGPFPLISAFNFLPYKAATSADIIFPAKIEAYLKGFFGKTKPIQITERIAFNDDTQSKLTIAGLDHHEAIAGIKIKWSGFDSNIEYSGDFKSRMRLEGTSENLQVELPDQQFDLNHFAIKSDKLLGKTGLMLGSDTVQIDRLDAKLNNTPSFHFTLNKLAGIYAINEVEEYINAESKLDVASFVLDQKNYGPVRTALEMKHLYAPALLELGNFLNHLQNPLGSEKQTNDTLFLTYQDHISALLTHNPQIRLREFFLRTPDGDVKVQAQIAVNGFVKTDFDNLFSLWSKIDAQADIVVPRTVLENLLSLQVQRLLGTGNVEINPDAAAFIRQMVDAKISQWVQEKYIRIEGKNLVSRLSLQNGQLVLNDNAIVLN